MRVYFSMQLIKMMFAQISPDRCEDGADNAAPARGDDAVLPRAARPGARRASPAGVSPSKLAQGSLHFGNSRRPHRPRLDAMSVRVPQDQRSHPHRTHPPVHFCQSQRSRGTAPHQQLWSHTSNFYCQMFSNYFKYCFNWTILRLIRTFYK